MGEVWIFSGTMHSNIDLCEIHIFSQKELAQLFSEVGNVQDCHLQPQDGRASGYTYGLVDFTCTLIQVRLIIR